MFYVSISSFDHLTIILSSSYNNNNNNNKSCFCNCVVETFAILESFETTCRPQLAPKRRLPAINLCRETS